MSDPTNDEVEQLFNLLHDQNMTLEDGLWVLIHERVINEDVVNDDDAFADQLIRSAREYAIERIKAAGEAGDTQEIVHMTEVLAALTRGRDQP